MAEEDTLTETFDLLKKVRKRVSDLHRSLIQKYGLSLSQYCILKQLWDVDEKAFKDLAECCHISRSTATGVVDTLEEKALVSRKTNPEDRRSIFVKLTDKGKSIRQVTPSQDAIVPKHKMQGEEIRTLNNLLAKLFKSLESV
ncbi:MAG: MarR family transcriptional regulator [Promethearchaeota archaeon CR_4]|nr:MAG: MarR family transcriptional regulator [Candidatus Lokiarchaeota archaeon CR_4]